MEKEKTFYEKAIEKEKEVDVILQIINNGSMRMWEMEDYDRCRLDRIFGKAFPYINKAIRRNLRQQIIITAKQIALDELKKARKLASDEARKILTDCEKEIPEENTYTVLRCKECGAYMSKRQYVNNIDIKFWECNKCGKDYYKSDEISYTIAETLSRKVK